MISGEAGEILSVEAVSCHFHMAGEACVRWCDAQAGLIGFDEVGGDVAG